ncbi:tetratricopeptide repeat protein [Eudoraea chungangensis]|uniref:tetratricopeptide repeat protein n=1 Tax=Eudoraea chungangensis TaxID=1481905 RepID=UPI0023ED489D|nr:hypothetical protein [Eudoraea chungangensis]
MRMRSGILAIGFSISFLIQGNMLAQEEKNASLYLEAYTDEFQNMFFEALKQKSIENYDKAVNQFLKCKSLDETNPVIDFQLADCYSKDGQYLLAQSYSINAVKRDPENYWYLSKLVEIMDKQYSSIGSIEKELPRSNMPLTRNLAMILFRQGKYEEVKKVLDVMKDSAFKIEYLDKIKDSIRTTDETLESISNNKEEIIESPLNIYKREIQILLNENDSIALLNASEVAIEEYPTQPFFYYSKGVALNNSGNPEKAVQTLLEGLDFILEDLVMENSYYEELGRAYNLLGNSSKANMYLSKIKSGL